MIVQAFKTKTPFIIDSMVRAMTVMAVLAVVGIALLLAGAPAVAANLAFMLAMFQMPVVMHLSLKQGQRNRGPMPTLPPRP